MIRNYHQHLEHLMVQLHSATSTTLCPCGVFCTVATGPSRRPPRLVYNRVHLSAVSGILGISGAHYSWLLLLPPPHQHLDPMEVLSVDPTEVMHAPSVHSRVRIRHLLFHSPFTPSELRSENYKSLGMHWYQTPANRTFAPLQPQT